MKKRSPISQREAWKLKRRVRELEDAENQRRNAWSDTIPGGWNISTQPVPDYTRAAVHTARLLGHAVVATLASDGQLRLYALPLGSRP